MCLAAIEQNMNMTNTVIWIGIAYNFYVVLYSLPTIKNLYTKIITLQKLTICGLLVNQILGQLKSN